MNNKDEFFKGVAALLLVVTIQALIVGLIVSFFWRLSLQYLFEFNMGFFHWFSLVFCFNLIRFDIIKMINDLGKNKQE